jgi:hypothetical protein
VPAAELGVRAMLLLWGVEYLLLLITMTEPVFSKIYLVQVSDKQVFFSLT